MKYQELELKLQKPTPEEIEELRVDFEHKLIDKGMTKKDWLDSVGWDGRNPSILSHVLAGRSVNTELLKAIISFVRT